MMNYSVERLAEELNHYDWSDLEPYMKSFKDGARIPPNIVKRITDVLVPYIEAWVT